MTFPEFLSTSMDPAHIATRANGSEHTSVVFRINTDRGAPTKPTLVFTDDEDIMETLQRTNDREREILLPSDMSFLVDGSKRVRYVEADGSSVEVLTLDLMEIR